MTPDASTVVGDEETGSASHGFRWTSATGMVPLAGNGDAYSWTAYGVDADGSMVVGACSFSTGVSERVGGVAHGPCDLLPLPPGFTESNAFGVSADGGVVVGTGINSAGLYTPWFWTGGPQAIDLASFLSENGINLDGWRLGPSVMISGDGRTIIGQGQYTYAPGLTRPEGWIVTIPAPACGVAVLAILAMARRR